MPADKEPDQPTQEQLSSSSARHNGAQDEGAKEKKVESTAGKNPNKALAPEKPQPKPRPAQAEPSVFGSSPGEFFQFLIETWQEFRKISWPTRQQVVRETWSVIILVGLITGAVLAFDFAIAKTVFEPMDKYAKKVGGGVGHTTSTWGPLAPRPGAPVNNPSVPGDALPTPQSLPTPPASAPSAPNAPGAPANNDSAAGNGATNSAPSQGAPASPGSPAKQ